VIVGVLSLDNRADPPLDKEHPQWAWHGLTRTLQRVNIATLSYFEQCPSDFGARENLLNTRGGDGWSAEPSDNGVSVPMS
jgi:hypothetical protein